ncbi:MAG: hypothetical protein M1504_03205 [Candidatus Marsarchaeota archaeon]|nr:hypothetical protein [Candidatus Marsarchaeota archaeon]
MDIQKRTKNYEMETGSYRKLRLYVRFLQHRIEMREKWESEGKHLRSLEDLQRGRFKPGDFAALRCGWPPDTWIALVEVVSITEFAGKRMNLEYLVHEGGSASYTSNVLITSNSHVSNNPYRDLFIEPIGIIKKQLLELEHKKLLRR